MQSDFSREHIVSWSIASLQSSVAFLLALIIVHYFFYWMLPKEVRKHKVFLGPFVLVCSAIFSLGVFPAGLLFITDSPLDYSMSMWGLSMLAPVCSLTYPIMLANAWLRFLATPKKLQRIGLLLAFAIGLFTVGPFLLGGFIDLFGILKERLF